MAALLLFFGISLLAAPANSASDQVCASKGQLGHRIFTSYKDNDQNDNGVVSGPEIYDLLSNSFDVDQDGCVSKTEWIDRSINVYKFSQEYAELIWPGDESRPCQLSVNDYKTSPLLLSKDEWLLTLTAELVEMCTGNPSLFSTNCDCIQLQPACEHDHEIRSNLACTVFIACNGKSSLAHRILANLRANDADDNKIVTGQEFVTDLTDNYDMNKDGCVNITEWVDRWTSFFNFSLEYAEGRFPGDESSSCPINISLYNDPRVQIPVDKFVSDNVQTLIDVCNNRDYSSLSLTNCDCDQLKDTCTKDPYFKTIESCISYEVCIGKGTLAQRLRANLKANDADDNKVVTGQEFIDDLTKNYDMDNDGCVSLNEWISRWVNFYNFTVEFAEGRFPGNESAPCAFDIKGTLNPKLQFPVDKFVSDTIQTLVDICSDRAYSSLAVTNCDCDQLMGTCSKDSYFKTVRSCLTYEACADKGALAQRLQANLKANDADDNKIVTGQEFLDDLTKNYDVDNDGCVSLSEWVDRWVNVYNFSIEYAEGRFPGNESASCGIDIKATIDPKLQIPVDKFVSDNIQTLIDICSDRVYSSLSVTNCDCDQLKYTCTKDSYFRTIDSCLSYVSCSGKGTLAQRLQANLKANDADDNKIVTGQEFIDDLSQNYDKNNDGCVSLQEWVERWVNFYNFSIEYAEGRFPGNESAPCSIDIKGSFDPNFQIPVANFVSDNMQTLIDICTSPAYTSLAKTNCDCDQLEDTCTNDVFFMTIASCMKYASTLPHN